MDSSIQLGDKVVAHSLVNATELNGLQGTVVAFQGSRIGVSFGGSHGTKALRPEHVRRITRVEAFDRSQDDTLSEEAESESGTHDSSESDTDYTAELHGQHHDRHATIDECLKEVLGAKLKELKGKCSSNAEFDKQLRRIKDKLQMPMKYSAVGPLPDDPCACCGKGGPVCASYHWCGACEVVTYCSRRCQDSHWEHHKVLCKKSFAPLTPTDMVAAKEAHEWQADGGAAPAGQRTCLVTDDVRRLFQTHLAQTAALVSRDDWEGALALCDESFQLHLQESALRVVDVAELLAELHTTASKCYNKLELYRRACHEATSCLLIMPCHVRALMCRAYGMEALGDFLSALADLQRIESFLEAPAKNKQRKKMLASVADARDRVHKNMELRVGLITIEYAVAADPRLKDHCRKRPHPGGWALGLESGKKQFTWFVDCYRLRLDDEYKWGGGKRHGIYSADCQPSDVIADFLVFCKLAKARGAIHCCWECDGGWRGCLNVAATLLSHKFNKADAEAKYGREELTQNMHEPRGGRSLRLTGDLIYGTWVQPGKEEDDLVKSLRRRIAKNLGKHPAVERFQGRLFADIGGDKVWHRLRLKCALPIEKVEYAVSDDEEGAIQLDVCAHCGKYSKPAQKLSKCSECKTVRYCSEACQKLNWSEHKSLCLMKELQIHLLS